MHDVGIGAMGKETMILVIFPGSVLLFSLFGLFIYLSMGLFNTYCSSASEEPGIQPPGGKFPPAFPNRAVENHGLKRGNFPTLKCDLFKNVINTSSTERWKE